MIFSDVTRGGDHALGATHKRAPNGLQSQKLLNNIDFSELRGSDKNVLCSERELRSIRHWWCSVRFWRRETQTPLTTRGDV